MLASNCLRIVYLNVTFCLFSRDAKKEVPLTSVSELATSSSSRSSASVSKRWLQCLPGLKVKVREIELPRKESPVTFDGTESHCKKVDL